jgi:hypothetical protein
MRVQPTLKVAGNQSSLPMGANLMLMNVMFQREAKE